MASRSELSFGNRLKKVQDLIQKIKTWKNYQPARAEETIAGMEEFVNDIIGTNVSETKTRIRLYTVIFDINTEKHRVSTVGGVQASG